MLLKNIIKKTVKTIINKDECEKMVKTITNMKKMKKIETKATMKTKSRTKVMITMVKSEKVI